MRELPIYIYINIEHGALCGGSSEAECFISPVQINWYCSYISSTSEVHPKTETDHEKRIRVISSFNIFIPASKL